MCLILFYFIYVSFSELKTTNKNFVKISIYFFFHLFFISLMAFLAKVKTVTEKIRGMFDKDIEKLLSKNENESLLTIIDEIPIEFEDIHIVYHVAKQTRFEAIAEKGV